MLVLRASVKVKIYEALYKSHVYSIQCVDLTPYLPVEPMGQWANEPMDCMCGVLCSVGIGGTRTKGITRSIRRRMESRGKLPRDAARGVETRLPRADKDQTPKNGIPFDPPTPYSVSPKLQRKSNHGESIPEIRYVHAALTSTLISHESINR
jgi:hypothetical protein